MTPVPGLVRGQLARFLVVGCCTVGVDFVCYRALLALDVPTTVAKAVSFAVATVLAYVLNRLWTFGAAGGVGTALSFVALYGTTLLVNVGVNAAMLALLDDRALHVEVAFLTAQAVSTTINFAVMRQVVFARPHHGPAPRSMRGSTEA